MLDAIITIFVGGIVTMIANPLTIGAGYIAARRYDHPVVAVVLVIVLGLACALGAALLLRLTGTPAPYTLIETNVFATGVWAVLFRAIRRRRATR